MLGPMQRRLVVTGLAAVALGGCGAPARLASLPERLRGSSSFHGLPSDTRVILDSAGDEIMGRIALGALQRELAYDERMGTSLTDTADYLAISGGGENGAYGAGILTAWAETGTRPAFKAVTGVSTGALIAPFAFLGSSYDGQLERFYTAIEQSDVMTSRGLIAAALGDSLYDPTPLLRMIRSVMTADTVAAIGKEYSEKGRLLFISTTNLDVPIGVLWNIGGLAASGSPDAAELIAKILLASASIPGAFPPVMIDVAAGGEHFQEMHVDGGTVAQVVFYPPSFSGNELLAGAGINADQLRQVILSRKRRLYVIRNSRPGSDLETVDRSTLKIAGRAIATLISTQGIGDLYQLYVIAQRDHIDYNVTYIPASFSEKLRKPFDRDYMNKLYQLGRETMKSGRAWSKYPPGYDPRPLSQTAIQPAAGTI
jgi:predicted acylesterase/phospholipase RssA